MTRKNIGRINIKFHGIILNLNAQRFVVRQDSFKLGKSSGVKESYRDNCYMGPSCKLVMIDTVFLKNCLEMQQHWMRS
jgi:hypothetical protein